MLGPATVIALYIPSTFTQLFLHPLTIVVLAFGAVFVSLGIYFFVIGKRQVWTLESDFNRQFVRAFWNERVRHARKSIDFHPSIPVCHTFVPYCQDGLESITVTSLISKPHVIFWCQLSSPVAIVAILTTWSKQRTTIFGWWHVNSANIRILDLYWFELESVRFEVRKLHSLFP